MKGLLIIITIIIIAIKDTITLIENKNINKIITILLKQIRGYIKNKYELTFVAKLIRKITFKIRNEIIN